MSNFFYTDTNGTKQGPINEQQLKALVAQSIITPTTPLETDAGHKGTAGQIPGLFATEASPFAQTASTVSKLFCTNCGVSILENAVACMSCGASPVGHKKFCRHCGVGLNPEQIICIKCGSEIQTTQKRRNSSSISSSSPSSGGFGNWPMSRIPAALLGILLGGIGIHKFYLGSWGWGLVFVGAVIVTGGLLGLVSGVVGIIDGVRYLMMTDEEFAEKYSPETQTPFRW